ncbi:MAG: hypothetical protein LWW77_09640 [Propionibacteriales bacterium]|nr:hypothetical protein [Propionibacteriales bacterium]
MYEYGGFVPPGWPTRVPPPGVDGWERAAVAFLLECCPPVLSEAGLPRRYPVVLAHLAMGYLDGQRATSVDLLAGLRAGLAGQVEPDVVAAAVDALQLMEARLTRVRREAGLVAGALRGEVYRPRL